MNISILFIIFNRPENTNKVFDSIRSIKPMELFIAADGPREGRENEDLLCKETRSVIERVDWPCKVHTLFNNKNLGCHAAVPAAISWFFENVEEGIILEDDCLANESFFLFCIELLNKYRDNSGIMMISGDNFQEKNSNVISDSSYYFSKYANIWGWATWKRSWEKYNNNFDSLNDEQMRREIMLSYRGEEQQKYWYGFYKKIKQKRIPNWDAKWFLSIIYNKGLSVSPHVNLVQNIGFGPDATTTIDEYHLSVTSNTLDKIFHPTNFFVNYDADYLLFKKIYFKSIIKRVFLKIKNLFK